MNVFRLCRYDRTPLDGVGGLYADGRWHRIGSRIVYTAPTVSLGILESRVHHETAPRGWVIVEAIIPDNLVEALDPSVLPPNWLKDRSVTQEIGEKWLKASRSLALRVPSVIVPSEFNYLLNPQHPSMAHIQAKPSRPFEFDARLFRGPSS